jgi:hypothetical protein
MVYRGHVVNGLVKLDESVQLPEGAEVNVELVGSTGESPAEQEEVPTLYERLRSLAGAAKGLPPDMSVNVDHYLYGSPKRQ